MKNQNISKAATTIACSAFLLAVGSAAAAPLTVNLYAKVVWVNPVTGNAASDEGSPALGRIPMWGFATTVDGVASVPGPKIDVSEAEVAHGLVIVVNNQLTEPVSVVIPGLNGSTVAGQPARFDAADPDFPNRVRSLVPEAAPGASATYTWTGSLKLGTYGYHSGSHPALQVQMGLYGMVTVRGATSQVYAGYSVPLDRETPVIFSEVDPALHWAVQTNAYGPGKALSSTIHADPSLFLINGRAYSQATPPPNLAGGARGQQTLFRMLNFCWNSRIPTLAGPVPTGANPVPGSGAHYLTAIAEDGNLYPFARTAYAANLAPLKSMDFLFTPPDPGVGGLTYMVYDHRLGLSGAADPNGGMYARWIVQ